MRVPAMDPSTTSQVRAVPTLTSVVPPSGAAQGHRHAKQALGVCAVRDSVGVARGDHGPAVYLEAGLFLAS